MRLFCREDHEPIVTVIDNPARDLLEARAKLAKTKKLPLSAFTAETHRAMGFGPYGPITYTVDNRDDAIARMEAEVAELEILAKGVQNG